MKAQFKNQVSNPEGLKNEWYKAVNSFREGDKQGALYVFKKIAKEGVLEAYVEIGNIYHRGGGGITRDVNQAVYWYQKAIDQGNDPKAYLALGEIYLYCDQNQPNFDKAYEYFTRAASENEPGAFFALGYMSERGLAKGKDLDRAIDFYESAIKHGHILAHTRISKIFFYKRKFVKAISHYSKGLFLGLVAVIKNPDDRRLRVN